MAIIDKSQKRFIADRDETQFIGLKIPLILDNGEKASTKTTLEAVKQNVFNLCNTERGERVMHPNLGLGLKTFLFEPFSEDVVESVKESIIESLNTWLPFVQINEIEVDMSDNNSDRFRSTLEIFIRFSLVKDPSINESIQIKVGE